MSGGVLTFAVFVCVRRGVNCSCVCRSTRTWLRPWRLPRARHHSSHRPCRCWRWRARTRKWRWTCPPTCCCPPRSPTRKRAQLVRQGGGVTGQQGVGGGVHAVTVRHTYGGGGSGCGKHWLRWAGVGGEGGGGLKRRASSCYWFPYEHSSSVHWVENVPLKHATCSAISRKNAPHPTPHRCLVLNHRGSWNDPCGVDRGRICRQHRVKTSPH